MKIRKLSKVYLEMLENFYQLFRQTFIAIGAKTKNLTESLKTVQNIEKISNNRKHFRPILGKFQILF